jgi:hypothetical protein
MACAQNNADAQASSLRDCVGELAVEHESINETGRRHSSASSWHRS